jgi:hypothetical protein
MGNRPDGRVDSKLIALEQIALELARYLPSAASPKCLIRPSVDPETGSVFSLIYYYRLRELL